MDDFGAKLDRFIERRELYRPRAYVTHNLNIAHSGELYAKAYFEAAAG